MRTQARLRKDLFGAFTRASWTVQSLDREGHLQELITDQVTVATEGMLLATALLTGILMSCGIWLASALVLNPTAALAVVGLAAALFVMLRPLGSMGKRTGLALTDASLEYAGGASEAVRVAQETHVFGVAAVQQERFAVLVDEIRRPYFQVQLLARLVPGFYQSLLYLFVLGGLALVFAAGATHAASLGAVVLLLVRASTYGQVAQGSYQGLRQTLPHLERVDATRRRYALSARPAGTRRLERVQRLGFEGVSF